MTKKLIITEETPSAATRHPKAMPYDDFSDDVEKAIAHFASLNSKQRERVLGAIQQTYLDAGTGRGTFSSLLHQPYQNGAGLPDGTSEKNIQLQKNARATNNEEWRTVADWLSGNPIPEPLAEMGFDETTLETLAQSFHNAVNERVNNHYTNPFQVAISEFSSEWGFSPFLSDEEIDVVALLTARAEELEEMIAKVEAERESLEQEINTLSEGAIYTTNHSLEHRERNKKHSTIDEYMLQPTSPEDAFNDHQHVSIQMQRYLDVGFGRDEDF